jgi:hypothetical protein
MLIIKKINKRNVPEKSWMFLPFCEKIGDGLSVPKGTLRPRNASSWGRFVQERCVRGRVVRGRLVLGT